MKTIFFLFIILSASLSFAATICPEDKRLELFNLKMKNQDLESKLIDKNMEINNLRLQLIEAKSKLIKIDIEKAESSD